MSTKSKAADNLDPTSGNVEQIREILFGGHIRAFDERFDLVESRLAKESATLQKALERRVRELEQKLEEFRDQASDQLGAESNSKDLALNKIELALASARMDAENQMAQLQDNFNTEIKAVRSELKAAHKELSTALSRAEKTQDKRADKLEADKVARSDLSKFFTEIAQKIKPGPARKGK
jgi:F0F1-type ATP synthase membrane subunit b/b'